MQHLRKVPSVFSARVGLRCFSITTSLRSKGQTTINPEEVSKFQNVADDWWSSKRDWRLLRDMNQLRVPFVRNGIVQTHGVDAAQLNSAQPLKNFKILDVGCGGGLLAEPLARLGADVTGIDPVQGNVDAAEKHAKSDTFPGDLKYKCSTVEMHASNFPDHYDAVVSSEVVEHVEDIDIFIKSIIELTKNEGSIFITTINKTFLSWLLVKHVAEYVLHLVPAGTHDWEKFVPPNDLEHLFTSNSCHVRSIQGIMLLPFIYKWRWTSNISMNYAMHAVKHKDLKR